MLFFVKKLSMRFRCRQVTDIGVKDGRLQRAYRFYGRLFGGDHDGENRCYKRHEQSDGKDNSDVYQSEIKDREFDKSIA